MTRACGIIVAMNADRVIGKAGTTPWHYSADLSRFKRMTLETTVIMGRKTWDSLPFKPLPKRHNIVITRGADVGVTTCGSLPEALESAQREHIWVIGGAEIYALALKHCNEIDITYVPDRIEGLDCTYFPAVDWSQWSAGPKIQFQDDGRLFRQKFTLM